MKQELKVYSRVTGGKLSDAARTRIVAALTQMEGQEVLITIGKREDKRSLDQNSFYWKVIVPMARMAYMDTGEAYSIEQTHEALLAQFAPTGSIKLLDATVKAVPIRSKQMSVPEFSQYIEAITATLATFGYTMEGQL